MKAVRFHQHGGPEVLRLEDVADPSIGPGEALVRVRACALNHLDLWQRRGLRRVAIPMPHISGSDVAGEIVVETNGGDIPPGIPGHASARDQLRPVPRVPVRRGQ